MKWINLLLGILFIMLHMTVILGLNRNFQTKFCKVDQNKDIIKHTNIFPREKRSNNDRIFYHDLNAKDLDRSAKSEQIFIGGLKKEDDIKYGSILHFERERTDIAIPRVVEFARRKLLNLLTSGGDDKNEEIKMLQNFLKLSENHVQKQDLDDFYVKIRRLKEMLESDVI